MSRPVDLMEAGEWLLEHDDYLILTHRRPDGDTVGCAAALCRGLRQKGKRAFVFPNEDLTPRLGFLLEGLTAPAGLLPAHILAVDIADRALLTEGEAIYGGRVALCIDHHPSNTGYAERLLLQP